MNLVQRRSGVIPAGGCPVPANRPILNSDRGIRTTSSLRTIRCQSNGQFRVTCHLTTVDRPLHKGGASHERRTRERFARFRGFNSVSTDPGSVCLRPWQRTTIFSDLSWWSASRQIGFHLPTLGACAGLSPSLFQFAGGAARLYAPECYEPRQITA
jgi:hypothetical protein